MRIYDWRLDLPVNPIEIGFTISLTIQPKIYKQVVVYGPLVPRNQLQALNLRSSRCVPVQEQV
jgi:hypothetical protein